ncbi:hypothetical protein E2C01_081869 [Portunus trituberculatus]|uniref:Uncharacterized protein n=1 Tax=Portunus trituberculatus TaxID=210409 RepID=A0A5B7IQW8_PORTR|nr:hypothetical protein [Portunus trituberculatus]
MVRVTFRVNFTLLTTSPRSSEEEKYMHVCTETTHVSSASALQTEQCAQSIPLGTRQWAGSMTRWGMQTKKNYRIKGSNLKRSESESQSLLLVSLSSFRIR